MKFAEGMPSASRINTHYNLSPSEKTNGVFLQGNPRRRKQKNPGFLREHGDAGDDGSLRVAKGPSCSPGTKEMPGISPIGPTAAHSPLKREAGGTSSGPGSPRRPMANWPAATDGGLAMKRAALAKRRERPDCPPAYFLRLLPERSSGNFGLPHLPGFSADAKVSPPRQSSSGKTRSRLRIVINSFRLKSLWRTSRIAWTRIDFSMILRIYLPLEKRPFCSRDLTRTR